MVSTVVKNSSVEANKHRTALSVLELADSQKCVQMTVTCEGSFGTAGNEFFAIW